MHRILIGVFAFAAASAALPSDTAAQPAGEVAFMLPFVQLRAGSLGTEVRQDLSGGAALEHHFWSERARVFYDLDVESFGGDDGWRTALHNGGITARVGSDTRRLDVGGSVFVRANDGPWADVGFRGVNTIASASLRNSIATYSATYSWYLRGFPDAPALDQNEHLVSGRALFNLPTRTTIVGNMSAGRKHYSGDPAYYQPPLIDLPTGTMLNGRGYRRSAGTMVPLSGELVPSTEAVRTEWSWAVRLAQSLADRTGVWLEREQRQTAGDPAPAVVWTPPTFYDDGVYDDPYVIGTASWRGGAKQVFSGGEIQAWTDRSVREYDALSRTDTLFRAGIDGVTQVWGSSRLAIDLRAGYMHLRNDSSDPAGSYTSNAIRVGVGLRF